MSAEPSDCVPLAPASACVGVCLFVITAGALPFDEPNLGLLFKKIQKADYQTPAWFSRDLAHLLRAIITPDPKARSAPLMLGTGGQAAMYIALKL